MKFSVFNWKEIPNEKWLQAAQGSLRVMCAPSQAVYVECEGVEALAGYGPNVSVQIAEPFRFKIDGKGRAFVEDRQGSAYVSGGSIFTNADRMPMESGSMLEVTRAMRAFKLEQRELLNQVRAERRALDERRQPKAPEPAQPEPVLDTAKPEPKPEPKPEATE